MTVGPPLEGSTGAFNTEVLWGHDPIRLFESGSCPRQNRQPCGRPIPVGFYWVDASAPKAGEPLYQGGKSGAKRGVTHQIQCWISYPRIRLGKRKTLPTPSASEDLIELGR
jgi:hypothetical protein